MRIVLLDADPITGSARASDSREILPSLRHLESLGALEVHTRTDPAEVVERLQGAAIALTNKVVLSSREFAALPDLRLVSVLATGVNVVDLAAAREAGVTVCNVPGYSTASTAQHTIALLLELVSQVGRHAADVASGGWQRSPAFSYYLAPLVELDGLTLGIAGFGAIGQRVAKIARALGMRVLVHTRTPQTDSEVRFVDKQTLLRESDVVSLHVPLSPETRHYLDGTALRSMKASALVINCSRGPLIDEPALRDALESGIIAGAALDVLDTEPPRGAHPLLGLPNCLVTPHVAWATAASRERLLGITADNIRAFLAGNPQNVVSA
jgi:glycerate dehydrogenase